MYLPQANPDQELTILPYADRLEIMLEDQAIRAAAARECLIVRSFIGATTPQEHTAAADEMIAAYIDDLLFVAELCTDD
jgi:hypothetical protein